jgi:hypothetical protein
MPKAKSDTKSLTNKELSAVIKSYMKDNCPVVPKKKAELLAVSKRLGLPTSKPVVARTRKPKRLSEEKYYEQQVADRAQYAREMRR